MIVSFDINSLYPHLIMQYNISPEKMIGKPQGISVNKMLQQKTPLDYLQTISVQLRLMLCLRQIVKVLPKLIEKMYNDRVHLKS